MLHGLMRHGASGAQPCTVHEVRENLIIKGDNLAVLRGLHAQYANSVKMIYIDPPYNTGSTLFQYDDRAEHTAWLAFMEPCLMAGYELLQEQGVIFVHCDDNEQAYLKVLMDRLFGRENFVDTFIWKNTDNAPALSRKSRKNVEFIHCYEKNLDRSIAYRGRPSANDHAPLLNSGNSVRVLEFPAGSIRFGMADGVYAKGNYHGAALLNELTVEQGRNAYSLRLEGAFKWSQATLDEEIARGTYFLVKTAKMAIRYQRAAPSILPPDKLIDGVYLSKAIGIGTNEDSHREARLLNSSFGSYPKPESLLAFLINAVTQEGDLVLDFFLGGGTTAAVAHKMRRRYIGIEIMDYVEDAAVARLKRVIAGETGGVSKAVGWIGGGSFCYGAWEEAARDAAA